MLAGLGYSAPSASAVAQSVALGVNTVAIADDSGGALDAVRSASGARPSVAMYYQDFDPSWSTALVDPRVVTPIAARGAIPMITWEPWLSSRGTAVQPDFALTRITAGAFDDYLRRAASEARAYGGPLLVRFAHEMNGTWYPWGAAAGTTPSDYVDAWRHVVGVFRAAGATNVRWVWSPNVVGGPAGDPRSYFPGDAWVDWLAMDGYNWGATRPSGWQSLEDIFGSTYDELASLSVKPIMIGETASAEAGGDKAAWIRANLGPSLTQRMPRLRAVTWFDRLKETDWRIASSPASALAFRGIVGSLNMTAADLITTPDAASPTPPVAAAHANTRSPASATRPKESSSNAISAKTAGHLELRRHSILVRGRRATLRVRCTGGGSCRARKHVLLRAPQLKAGGATARLASGRSSSVHVRLTRSSARRLRGHRRVRAAVVLLNGAHRTAQPVWLRPTRQMSRR